MDRNKYMERNVCVPTLIRRSGIHLFNMNNSDLKQKSLEFMTPPPPHPQLPPSPEVMRSDNCCGKMLLEIQIKYWCVFSGGGEGRRPFVAAPGGVSAEGA